jgi:hypothetical protein
MDAVDQELLRELGLTSPTAILSPTLEVLSIVESSLEVTKFKILMENATIWKAVDDAKIADWEAAVNEEQPRRCPTFS